MRVCVCVLAPWCIALARYFRDVCAIVCVCILLLGVCCLCMYAVVDALWLACALWLHAVCVDVCACTYCMFALCVIYADIHVYYM